MHYSKWLGVAAMAVAIALSPASARAEDRDWGRVNRLRAVVAADQYRLNENIRCGRRRAAEQDRRDLYRHQRELDRQLRDIHRDRAEMYWNRR